MIVTLKLVAESKEKALLYLADHLSKPGSVLSAIQPPKGGIILRYRVSPEVRPDLEQWWRSESQKGPQWYPGKLLYFEVEKRRKKRVSEPPKDLVRRELHKRLKPKIGT